MPSMARYDLRGISESDKPTGPYSMAELAPEVKDILTPPCIFH
jgi:hypothetical protein